MGATLSGSPKFVLSDAATKNFNMTGAISMQCLQNHRHFGTACRCNDFGKASAAQRRQSAHASTSDLHGHRERTDWDRDANNNAGSKHTSTGKTLPYVPSGADAGLASVQPRYHYQHQHQLSTTDRPSTHGYHAEPLKPSKSLASLKESARSNGQLANEGVVGLPALKPKLAASPTGSGRPLRPHSQAFSASQSMNQLRVTHPAVINSLNGTLAMASRRVSSIFTKKNTKESAGRHVRSITVDNTTTSSSSDAFDSHRSAVSNAPPSRSSMLVDARVSERERERGATEKENSVYENAPSHNYRQPIPKSISCYNIKSQQQAHSSAEGGAADTTHSAQPESRAQNRKTILQASTTELLHYLSEYLYRQIPHLHSSFRPVDAIAWIRSADKNLILQGWSDINFINPANVVFLFMMLRNVVDYREIRSVNELHTITMTCLYLAYSYMGNEISYPLKPFFLSCDDRDVFWQRCVDIINLKSTSMLRLNTDPAYFAETFAELKTYSVRTADSG